jgi:hypothetical protein
MCPSICSAQQAASIDLTQIEPRGDLRRPAAREGDPTGHRGIIEHVNSCNKVPPEAPAVQTTLVWVDRDQYAVGDDIKFEVRILNTGSVPLKLPFSPHLADFQPADPSRKFAYSEMVIGLELSSVLPHMSSKSSGGGGGVILYGNENHPGTMLTLQPGEWAQIVGKSEFRGIDWPPEASSKDAVSHLNATITISQNETLLTSADAATTERYVCLNQTAGHDVPIKLRTTD